MANPSRQLSPSEDVSAAQANIINDQITPKLQAERYEVLVSYKEFVSKSLNGTVTGLALDDYCYPPAKNASFKALHTLLKEYIDDVVRNSVKVTLNAPKISARTLAKTQGQLIKCICEIYTQRHGNMKETMIPNRKELTETLDRHSSQLIHQDDVERWARIKAFQTDFNCEMLDRARRQGIVPSPADGSSATTMSVPSFLSALNEIPPEAATAITMQMMFDGYQKAR